MREHDFQDEFGPCIGCGKYVEQLIEERYCSMSKENKYPNADTSPERLAEIEKFYLFLKEKPNPFAAQNCMARDLLAMLQERQETDRAMIDVQNEHRLKIKSLEQQLHDQRWRRLSEEEPGLSQIIGIFLHDRNPTDDLAFTIICFGVIDTDEAWEWWFPVMYLPETYPIKLQRKGPENNP